MPRRLPLNAKPCRPFGRQVWFGAGLAALCLLPALAAQAQMRITDAPTTIARFEKGGSYADLLVEIYGTPVRPTSGETGVLLGLRMFRNICTGVERGTALETLTPDGFAPVDGAPYYFGPDMPARGEDIVLSVTGDIETDEAGGHPAIWLEQRDSVITCAFQWKIPDALDATSTQAIASVLHQWVPYEMSLVLTSRPAFNTTMPLTGLIEWDRPCGDKWCSMTALYDLKRGDIALKTRLNTTRINGKHP